MDLGVLYDLLVRIGIIVLIYNSAKMRWTLMLLVSFALVCATFSFSVRDYEEAPWLHTMWIFFASTFFGVFFYSFVVAVRNVRSRNR